MISNGFPFGRRSTPVSSCHAVDAMTHTRFLIVHPDPSAIARLESMLHPLRCETVAATSPRPALRLLATRPGLVLMGVDPADQDALELLTYIRRHHDALPVILLSPDPHPDLVLRA